MKIQTMSIVVGSEACQAHCPFCISKITGNRVPDPDNINWRNFKIACQLANRSGVTTVLLTGKGEPTLYPNLISKYLYALEDYDIPFKELQTNGILLERGLEENTLKDWYALGLTTVCLSVVSNNSEHNHEIYQPDIDGGYMDVLNTIKKIQDNGLMVRLSCMLLKDYIDTVEKLQGLIFWCKTNKVKQLTVRPIDAPANVDNERTQWVNDHTLGSNTVMNMQQHLKDRGTPILNLAHGGIVYDVDGQNVCWATCMTTNKSAEDMRQIIFYPNGTISHSWSYKGAVLL